MKIAIEKCIKYPSILRTKQLVKNPTEFYFAPMDKDLIVKEIKNLNFKKANTKDDIPVKILKLNKSFTSQYFSKIFN